MLFPDEPLFDYVLIDLAETVATHPIPAIDPLPCDRWVARSSLQKAIRRADADLAVRALANLFEHDRRATWRHLAIIALEDVGVANADLLAQIIAAQRNRKWRDRAGGEWAVLAELVRQMALSDHCQAACDLLLRATNDPSLEADRTDALDSDHDMFSRALWSGDADLEQRALSALAIGGGLAEGQQHHDPYAVFDILADGSQSTHIIASCRAAWKLTRNPMAFLMPLVWERWIKAPQHHVVDDSMPSAQMIDGVPGYALDQFTRIGNTISRALLKSDRSLQDMLSHAGIASTAHPRAVGDLLFLIEGGLLKNRMIWTGGEELRKPHRLLPTVASAHHHTKGLIAYLDDKGSQIASLRQGIFSPFGGIQR